MNRNRMIAFLAALVMTPVAVSQTAHVYSVDFPPFSGVIRNQPLVPTACGGQTLVAQQAVNLPLFSGYPVVPDAPAPIPLGGHALSLEHDTEYWTDGTLIHTAYHPLYDTVEPVAAPLPCPPGRSGCGITTWPCPTPGLSGGGVFGPVTGMAIRENGVCPATLFVTDGSNLMGLTPCPGLFGYGVLQAPCAMPATVTSVPYTGLEVDSATGWIIAVDLAGWSYVLLDCNNCGFPPPPGLGPFAPPASMPPLTQIIGNVLDRGSYQYWIVSGTTMFGLFGTPNITLAPISLLSIPRGASFSAEPLVIPACGPGTYASVSSPVLIETTEPIVAGAPLVISLDAPAYPNASAALVVSASCVQSLFDCPFCWFWADFSPPGTYTNVVSLDGSGRACVPVGTVPNAIGAVGYAQWVVLDFTCGSVHPWVFSDALHGRISNP